MMLSFYKYQGTGNDFILLDNRDLSFPKEDLKFISKLCDRRFGIGSDGLILIENHPELDFEMVFFNPDGSQSMCGNGSRCAVMFAKRLEIIKDETTFLSTDGVHTATINGNEVRLSMSDVSTVEQHDLGLFLNTGSPHLIIETEQLQSCDIPLKGSEIRYNDQYQKEGVNINFIENNTDHVSVRTYERGVENETLSCGTGVTAVALASSSKGYESPVNVETKGGRLQVEFTKASESRFEDIFLTGPAEFVFEGKIDV
ncbi:MAG: diaminopimelate epimerase [Bacteroidota bacterium]